LYSLFLLSKALDTHLDFDLTLARTKNSDNPVYYAQYAYARICSVLASEEVKVQDSYNLLTSEKEMELLKIITSFPDVVADAAMTRSPNKICNYVQKLASNFHSFYGNCKINDKNNLDLSSERLALTKATQVTLRNALELLGVSSIRKNVITI
jgi:Arginyl-tRNA synthetase